MWLKQDANVGKETRDFRSVSEAWWNSNLRKGQKVKPREEYDEGYAYIYIDGSHNVDLFFWRKHLLSTAFLHIFAEKVNGPEQGGIW